MSIDPTISDNDGKRYDPLRLDNQLCFGLYAASNAITRAYRMALGELGLTYPQYLCLLALWESDRQSVSELGERLHLDSGTLTPVLRRLEKAGLLVRARSRPDEREVEVTLTARGVALREEAVGIRTDIVCRLGMSEREIHLLRQDLDRVIGSLASASTLSARSNS